jgi:hypothetical protein
VELAQAFKLKRSKALLDSQILCYSNVFWPKKVLKILALSYAVPVL